MTNKQTSLFSGAKLLVRESVLKGSGPKGDTGATGPSGPAFTIKGIRTTYTDLLAMSDTPELEHNDGWMVDDTGVLYIWYRYYPDQVGSYVGYWKKIGRIRGNPGYLNSVGARLSETASALSTDLSANATSIIKWDVTLLDTEVVPIETAGEELLENQIRPILKAMRYWDASNVVATTDVDRVQPTVPPTETLNPDYPMGSSAFLVNIAVDYSPAVGITPRGFVRLSLYHYPTAGGRVLVAQSDGLIVNVDQTYTLSTFVRGSDGGQYDVEIHSNVAGSFSTRRFEWVRAGGGPGPQGDPGIAGEPVRAHADSPTDFEADLQIIDGQPGEMIYTKDTGKAWIWQQNTTTEVWSWSELGVLQGADGDANSGFQAFGDLVTGPDSEAGIEETAYPSIKTPDQGAPYPQITGQPRIPWYFREFGEWVEKRIISRFTSTADRSAKRGSPAVGEVGWVNTDGSDPQRGLDVYTGDQGYVRIPLIVTSTQEAPGTATTWPDGTLWVRY